MIEAGKYYEVQKYCSVTEHMWDGLWIIANGKQIKALAPDDQAMITKAFEAATMKQRAETARLNVALESALKGKGLEFNHPDKKLFLGSAFEKRFLCGMEGQVWRRRLEDAGKIFGDAGLNADIAASRKRLDEDRATRRPRITCHGRMDGAR